MNWWGKLVGGAFGYLLGGPLGALLGAALGHRFDQGLSGLEAAGPGDQERVQTAFFTASFAVMGHIAKADGRVSSDEVAMAEQIMRRMNLSAEMRRTAIRLFNEGKAADFPLDEVLEQFRRECHRRRNLLRMFLEIQLHAAYADGRLEAREAELLAHICQRLGISQLEFRQIEALVRAAHEFAGGARQPAGPPPADRLQQAYAVLGVSPGASDAEVKKAYRRLMNQHHPDKLVAKGLPEEMIELATEKTQEIKAAYDTVRAARNQK
ncbi:co-chaperone DjlA [Thiohalobacter sp. IOR34]|uniref:co-chaperone DjlA n=1 Tax=Thiohalobacter sp. IOR34 TaxID=3057176 RepID=UPI0025B0FEDE|nr:co-chaperone DjlA [Thiohalobacter sp. IOR34]WJW75839.1 co-chaperone DjlA [Thiohalobacter sp. IOR34]